MARALPERALATDRRRDWTGGSAGDEPPAGGPAVRNWSSRSCHLRGRGHPFDRDSDRRLLHPGAARDASRPHRGSPLRMNHGLGPTYKNAAPLVPQRNLYLRTACGLSPANVTFSRTWPRFARAESGGRECSKDLFEIFLCRNLRDFSKDISRPTLCIEFVTRDSPGQNPG